MKIEGLAAVTGAGQGIGLAVATELARRGFDVLATVLDATQVATVTAATRGLKGQVQCQVLDIRSPGDFQFPAGLRVLVNNAGIRQATYPAEEFTQDDWRAIFDVNFFGLVAMTRLAIPRMRAAGQGVICNVTSGSILRSYPFLGPYRASKAAVSSLCETLRLELAPFGIRVVEVLPGFTESGLNKDSPARRLSDAARFPAYAPMAQLLHEANSQVFLAPTPAADAASAIVDAILDHGGPMRYGTDATSVAALEVWRTSSDEQLAAAALAPFAPLMAHRQQPD